MGCIFSNNNSDHDDPAEKQSIYALEWDPSLSPFFQGQILVDRMKLIRQKFIEPIRQKFGKGLFEKNMQYFRNDLDTKEREIVSKVKYQYWNQGDDATFEMIKAYTNDKINKKIINLVNITLRKQEVVEQSFQLSVFLIEVINIELYLLTRLRPELDNFQGKTYRGFTCYGKDYRQFLEVLEKPLEDRVISVPLSLWGSSKQLSEAQRFFIQKRASGILRIMLTIHVISLDKQDLDFYRQNFPTSIVSTICAVDISSLSFHPKQQQVLLRGSFCLILRISTSISSVDNMEYHNIECVMVNANRDHISTNNLGDKAANARSYFAAINKKARMTFAERFLREEQEANKADYFKKKIEDEGVKIEQLGRKLRSQS